MCVCVFVRAIEVSVLMRTWCVRAWHMWYVLIRLCTDSGAARCVPFYQSVFILIPLSLFQAHHPLPVWGGCALSWATHTKPTWLPWLLKYDDMTAQEYVCVARFGWLTACVFVSFVCVVALAYGEDVVFRARRGDLGCVNGFVM